MSDRLPEQMQGQLPLEPWEARIMRVFETDRARCSCAPYRKPCVYHEGMRDACEIIAINHQPEGEPS